MSIKKGLDAPTPKPSEDTNLKAAIAYSQMLGWKVFPIHYKSKTPITQHGFKDATDNLEQIKDWWGMYPNAGIGLPTGEINNVVVMDIDPRNNGNFSFDRLIDEKEKIPHTVECLTGGGGTHFYFNYNNLITKSQMPGYEGIDIQGNGKYVVLPPSTHPNGNKYEWELSSKPVVTNIADMPKWLLDMLTRPTEQTYTAKSSDYWTSLFNIVGEGNRNNAVASLAGHLFRHYVNPTLIVEIMHLWNQEKVNPPLEIEELDKTINSIARAEFERREKR